MQCGAPTRCARRQRGGGRFILLILCVLLGGCGGSDGTDPALPPDGIRYRLSDGSVIASDSATEAEPLEGFFDIAPSPDVIPNFYFNYVFVRIRADSRTFRIRGDAGGRFSGRKTEPDRALTFFATVDINGKPVTIQGNGILSPGDGLPRSVDGLEVRGDGYTLTLFAARATGSS